MDSLRDHGDWCIIKVKLKHKWPVLTEADLCYTEGKEAELLEGLQGRLGISREAVESAILECRATTRWPTC